MRLMGTNKKFNWCLSFVLFDMYLAVKWNFYSWYTMQILGATTKQ